MAKAPEWLLSRLPARVWLLLEEDEYETKLGDGRFVYATAAFWDEAAAKARFDHLLAEDLEWRRFATGYSLLYTLKPVNLVRRGDEIGGDLKLEQDDRYTLEKVVELLSAAR
jgi:hypothetical protein